MFQHYIHEYIGVISFTFPYTADVLEVPLLKVAECMGRGKFIWFNVPPF